MAELSAALQRVLPNEEYLYRWVNLRESQTPLPTEFLSRWAPKAVEAYRRWLRPPLPGPLERQEQHLWARWEQGDYSIAEELTRFLTEVYPDEKNWPFFTQATEEASRTSRLFTLWRQAQSRRRELLHERQLSQELPPFHSRLITRLTRASEAEKALRALLTDKDFGWDLEDGIGDEQDWEPLELCAQHLAQDPALTRIAELIGRDWRSRQSSPPLPGRETEPGKGEIRGITWGRAWSDAVSSELSLLASKETAEVFFVKEAESRLLVWDYFTPAAPPKLVEDQQNALNRNERGPIIAVLDTSGSMRGEPEKVAKAAVLALARIAWQEGRPCLLINFSSAVRVLDITDLKHNLSPFLAFLRFSFHGGTDLTPALREALKYLAEGRFRDADVLVLSDFATPKIPSGLRTALRRQQEQGTKFYSLTVTTRPLNDFLNIFDAGWTYDIHPDRPRGISADSVTGSGIS